MLPRLTRRMRNASRQSRQANPAHRTQVVIRRNLAATATDRYELHSFLCLYMCVCTCVCLFVCVLPIRKHVAGGLPDASDASLPNEMTFSRAILTAF